MNSDPATSPAARRIGHLVCTRRPGPALDRGLAAVLVAALRHARDDWEDEPGAHRVPISNTDVADAVAWIAERAGSVLADPDVVDRLTRACKELLDNWDPSRWRRKIQRRRSLSTRRSAPGCGECNF